MLLKRSIKAWEKVKYTNGSSTKRKHTGLATHTIHLGLAAPPTMDTLCAALTAQDSCDCDAASTPPSTSVVLTPTPAMLRVLRGRTLWLTKSGRFVLGSYLRSGDHICLAYGCSNPIALRGEHEVTRVMGTCFLEGWMDAWGLRDIKKLEKELECVIFHIV